MTDDITTQKRGQLQKIPFNIVASMPDVLNTMEYRIMSKSSVGMQKNVNDKVRLQYDLRVLSWPEYRTREQMGHLYWYYLDIFAYVVPLRSAIWEAFSFCPPKWHTVLRTGDVIERKKFVRQGPYCCRSKRLYYKCTRSIDPST